jgi:hypothetical protein
MGTTEVLHNSKQGPNEQSGAMEVPYSNTLSWEPVVAATDEDIADMVSWADANLTQDKVKNLASILDRNWDVFMPALRAPGQAQHEVHRIEVDGHRPIKAAPQ